MKPLPSLQELQRWLNYDPATGIIRWRRRPSHRTYAGEIAGWTCTARKVRYVRINGECYIMARLIWKMMTGNDPVAEIDHKDLNPQNNRWANLREATHGQNQANGRKYKSSRLSTLKGATPYRKGWVARISINGRSKHLGVFDTEQEAHDAYVAASRQVHKQFHRAR